MPMLLLRWLLLLLHLLLLHLAVEELRIGVALAKARGDEALRSRGEGEEGLQMGHGVGKLACVLGKASEVLMGRSR